MTATQVGERPPALVSARRLAEAVPVWLWLTVIVVGSAAIRTVLASRHPAPWIFDDELHYWRLSVNFAHTGRFFLRGMSGLTGVNPGYPLLIAPASLIFNDLAHAYAAAKAINSLLMSLAAVPAYLLARQVLGRPFALLAAVFAVALPSLQYTGTIMTENAFYPAFLICALAFVRMLSRPTPLRQLLALAAIVVSFLIRAQAVLFVPALVTAVLTLVLVEARAEGELRQPRSVLRRLDRFRATGLALALGLVLLVAAEFARGRSLGDVLGAYQDVTGFDYTVKGVSQWFVYQLGELDLYLGFIPFAAFLVVASAGFLRRATPASRRVFAAVSVSLVLWFTLAAAAFSSQLARLDGIGRIEERNAFYVAPLFLIALLVWVNDGLTRRWPAVAFAAALAAALPGTLPLEQLANLGALADTLAFIPLARAQIYGTLMPSELSLVVVVAALIGTAVFLFLPRRFALVAPLCVLAYFIAWQTPVERQMRETSSGILGESIGVRREWIDEEVGGSSKVVALWTGVPNPLTIPEDEFFNRSVSNVYALDGLALGQDLSEQPVAVDRLTGRLLSADASLTTPYLLTDTSLQPKGRLLASDPVTGMVLYRVAQPLTIQARTTGRYVDGWSGPQCAYTRYGCRPGSLVVRVARYPGLVRGPQTVQISSGGRAVEARVLPPMATRRLTVPLRPSSGECTVNFQVSPTASPASALGSADQRELGVHADMFRYVPRRS
jgi:Dolichyl-phosphate-mannose-protein mannosyltransferase